MECVGRKDEKGEVFSLIQRIQNSFLKNQDRLSTILSLSEIGDARGTLGKKKKGNRSKPQTPPDRTWKPKGPRRSRRQ